ncbi:unnamed protein product [Urochloa humidicola]
MAALPSPPHPAGRGAVQLGVGDLRECVNGRQGDPAATSGAIAVLAVAREEEMLQLALPGADAAVPGLEEKPAQVMEHRSSRAGRRPAAPS